MSQNLEAALAFLSKFPQAKLFPAVWGWSEKQKCMTHCPLVAWSVKSSSDPEQIRKWLEGRPKRYACIALAQSGMSCLDVDNKKGKNGRSMLLRLELENEDLPETMQTVTPSGGDHYLFMGAMAQGTNKFGPGLDSAGMVPVPGSNAFGKGQYRIVKNGVVARVPEWLKRMAGEKKAKAERDETPTVDTDLEHNVKRAISYLQNAPEAIEGSGGDATAYKVACKVRDFGLSENMATELMHEYYADRCFPYDADWLESKVANAYQYAQKPLGASTAEAAFQDVEPPTDPMEYPEPGPQKIQVIAKRLIRSEINLRAITPRQWILGTRYIRQFVTLLVAPGGGSKSTLAMTELLSVALNRELTGDPVHVSGPVWIMNSEDPEDEVHRRLRAIMDHFKIDVDADYPNIHITGSEFDFCLAEENKRGKVTINHHAIEPIEAYIRDNGIVLWTLDPWVRAHRVGENDNNGIDALMKEVAGICRRTNSACSIIHHTRKGADIAGNMDSIRGASSLVSAARIADTLTVMSEKEAKRLGVNDKRRKHYVRIDGAKANLRPPAEDTKWFERIDVRLETGDHIGVLQPCEFDAVEEVDEMTRNITEFLALEMSPGDRMSVNQAAELLVDKYGARLVDEKGKTPAVRTMAGYIMKAYEVPVVVGRLQIRYVNEKIKGSNGCHFLSARRVELDEL
jgi:RecA-family ATPase